MTTKRTAMSQSTRFAVLKFMEPLIERDGEHCKYLDGWNDAKIVEQFRDCNVTQIRSLRAAVFGKLRDGVKPKDAETDQTAQILARLKSVEDRLAALERKQQGHPYDNFDTQHELSLLRSNGHKAQ